MLKDKVPFIVTDDISQLVMPRTAIKNAVTIRLGDNEVISGLATREIDDDVFGQDDVDSKEDEFMSNDGHDEFLNREEELMDDEQDQESLEEEDDTEFVDEELEQMREPEMKRGQIGGSLNGNRGKNGHKNAHSRVQDAFGGNGNNNEDQFDEFGNSKNDFVDEELEQMLEPEMKRGQIGGSLNGNRGKNAHSRVQGALGGNGNNNEDEFDEFENGQEEFEDEDEFAEKDAADEMAARYNRPPPSVRARITHKSKGAQKSKNSESNIRSKSYYMEDDLDYNNEDVYDEIDDGSERDGGALSYQHHNKAPERKAISRDFEDDLDYQDTFKSRSHGRINGEKRKGSKRAKKSTLGDNRRGKMGSMKRDGLPF